MDSARLLDLHHTLSFRSTKRKCPDTDVNSSMLTQSTHVSHTVENSPN